MAGQSRIFQDVSSEKIVCFSTCGLSDSLDRAEQKVTRVDHDSSWCSSTGTVPGAVSSRELQMKGSNKIEVGTLPGFEDGHDAARYQ